MKTPRIIYKYISMQYLKYFLIASLSITLVFFIIQAFDELKSLLELNVTINLLAKYLLFKIPYIILLTAPFASLLAALFTFTGLTKTNEIIAMRTNGISTFKIVLPVLTIAFFLSLFMIVLNETFASQLYAKSSLIRVKDIWKSIPTGAESKNNIVLKTNNKSVANIKYFNGERNTMEDITITFNNSEGEIYKRIDCNKANWTGNDWIFYNCYIRDFPTPKTEISNYYPTLKGLLTETPSEITSRRKRIDELTIRELYKEIKDLKAHSEKSSEEEVWLHFKISLAFSTFILAFLAIPFGLNSNKYSGVVLSFVVFFVVGYIYYQILFLGRTLGTHNVVPPALAGWFGNILFFIIGSILLFLRRA